MKSKLSPITIILIFLISTILFAQQDKSLKDKIKDIKGVANKIVISTDKGDVIFEGDDAKKLLKKLKTTQNSNRISWISKGDEDIEIDGDEGNVMIFKSNDGEKQIIKKIKNGGNVLIFKEGDLDDIDILEDGKMINVEVEVDSSDNGLNKKVTVTTTEDGEEKTEVFEGEDAEEYLEKMKKKGDMVFDFEFDEDSDNDNLWIHENGDMTKINKNVKVEVVDGKKKVTITTITDGDEKVEVLEGDKADEFLKKEKQGKKYKKIIIKESEEDE